ncbi:uncharacterized protein UV8b_01516 [Ustilaginoidea virens]|uniref:Uncharacterized protein n=2 Tax=Ustilaginoidea virens TaxID=1159556 RepID=A0A8E5HKT4_USTVR|nr:uncharacterized protein UV8b_01516 [Ustilaginoidea virens]QUC17275.1 hypothetical protein UV8b_01516 [Ustilaginoidea virens]
MPGSEPSSPSSAAPGPSMGAGPAGFGDNRGIKFQIRTGNARWTCTLQDRSHYERQKAARTNSTDSVASTSSSSSSSSSTTSH